MSKIYLKDGDVAVFTVGGKEIEVSKMTVTPEMASSIIEQSDLKFKNRKTRRVQVDAYAKDMVNGVWKTNGESIKFRKDGALIDGRHRMMAVAKAGIPRDFIAIGNLDEGVEDSIDIGMLRSFAAVLTFNKVEHENGVDSVVGNKLKLDSYRRAISASVTNSKYTRMDMVKEFIDNSDAYNDSVVFAKNLTRGQRVLTKTEVAAIYMHLTETIGWPKDFVQGFFQQLATSSHNGAGIFSTTMNRLSNRTKYQLYRSERITLFIACWNAYVMGNLQKLSEKKASKEWFASPNKVTVKNTNATVGSLNQIRKMLGSNA